MGNMQQPDINIQVPWIYRRTYRNPSPVLRTSADLNVFFCTFLQSPPKSSITTESVKVGYFVVVFVTFPLKGPKGGLSQDQEQKPSPNNSLPGSFTPSSSGLFSSETSLVLHYIYIYIYIVVQYGWIFLRV